MLTALSGLALAALLFAGFALSATTLLLTRLLTSLLRVAVLRAALLLLVPAPIVLLLVRHLTHSRHFTGFERSSRNPQLKG